VYAISVVIPHQPFVFFNNRDLLLRKVFLGHIQVPHINNG
jgi:hypothetical protein